MIFIHLVNLVIIPALTIIATAFISQAFRSSLRKLNDRAYNITVAPGTVLHELSHLLIALCFGMKINNVQLWSGKTVGDLGHVSFSYNSRSWFALVGLFFVGLAPLFVLLGASYVFIDVALNPNMSVAIINFVDTYSAFSTILNSLYQLLRSAADTDLVTLAATFIVLFFFIPHVVPSSQDLRLALKGSLPLAIIVTALLLLANVLGSMNYVLMNLYHLQYWFVLSMSLVIFVSSILFVWIELLTTITKAANR